MARRWKVWLGVGGKGRWRFELTPGLNARSDVVSAVSIEVHSSSESSIFYVELSESLSNLFSSVSRNCRPQFRCAWM